MKKTFKLTVVLLAVMCVFGGLGFAADVMGNLSSVDSDSKEITLQTGEGSEWFSYSETTVWPQGVTDPMALLSKQVTLSVDESTGDVTSVQLS